MSSFGSCRLSGFRSALPTRFLNTYVLLNSTFSYRIKSPCAPISREDSGPPKYGIFPFRVRQNTGFFPFRSAKIRWDGIPMEPQCNPDATPMQPRCNPSNISGIYGQAEKSSPLRRSSFAEVATFSIVSSSSRSCSCIFRSVDGRSASGRSSRRPVGLLWGKAFRVASPFFCPVKCIRVGAGIPPQSSPDHSIR